MNATDDRFADRLLTRKEAAEVLGFQPQTLARWKWIGRPNRPPEVRIGDRSIRYRASELATWIAAQADKPKN